LGGCGISKLPVEVPIKISYFFFFLKDCATPPATLPPESPMLLQNVLNTTKIEQGFFLHFNSLTKSTINLATDSAETVLFI
jgi:hypothetical protein